MQSRRSIGWNVATKQTSAEMGTKHTSAEMWVQSRRQLKCVYKTDAVSAEMQVQSRRSIGSNVGTKQTSAEMWVQNRRHWNVGQLKCRHKADWLLAEMYMYKADIVSAEMEIQSRRSINWNPCHLETGALIQFKMLYVQLERPIICVPPRLSEVSPTLPFKHF